MLNLVLHLLRGPLRSRDSLILENVALRHQLQVLSRGRKRPTLKNRSHEIVSVDFFTVPTITCRVLDVFLMIENSTRRIAHFNVTALVEAMGIEDVPAAPRPPRENPYMERLIGTMRRDCLDHVIMLNERHLHRVLAEYVAYYNETRTHLGLEKECPVPRAVEPPDIGAIQESQALGDLHHRYFREAAQMVNSTPDGNRS